MAIETEWIRHGEGSRYLGNAARPERATLPSSISSCPRDAYVRLLALLRRPLAGV